MNNNGIQPLTVTVEQAAKLLGIGRSTAYELVHIGDIPSLRLGRRIVVPLASLPDCLGVITRMPCPCGAEAELTINAIELPDCRTPSVQSAEGDRLDARQPDKQP